MEAPRREAMPVLFAAKSAGSSTVLRQALNKYWLHELIFAQPCILIIRQSGKGKTFMPKYIYVKYPIMCDLIHFWLGELK